MAINEKKCCFDVLETKAKQNLGKEAFLFLLFN